MFLQKFSILGTICFYKLPYKCSVDSQNEIMYYQVLIIKWYSKQTSTSNIINMRWILMNALNSQYSGNCLVKMPKFRNSWLLICQSMSCHTSLRCFGKFMSNSVTRAVRHLLPHQCVHSTTLDIHWTQMCELIKDAVATLCDHVVVKQNKNILL